MKILLLWCLLIPVMLLVVGLWATYALVSSIPPWLLAVAIGVLLYREHRRAKQGRRRAVGAPGARSDSGWEYPKGLSVPPVVYVFTTTPAAAPTPPPLTNPPERWILH